MKVTFSKICLFLNFVAIVNGANILYLAGIPSPSHGIWNNKLVEALSEKGHNITLLSMDGPKKHLKNTHFLSMAEVYEKFYEKSDIDDLYTTGSVFRMTIMLFEVIQQICLLDKETEGFKSLLNYPDNFKFDLVINDFSSQGCLLGFLHKFNYPPLINVSPYKYSTTIAEMFGGHQYAAYIPRPGLTYSVNMTVMQRLENVGFVFFELLYRKFIFQPSFDKLLSEMFADESMPSSLELSQRVSLFLLNTHPATDFPVPLPPNVIEVAGLQIGDSKPPPKELNDFIEQSKNGAVLISFGTNVNSQLFGNDKQKIVIDVIKKFPDYNFLWKFDKDPSEGKVANLLVTSWLPQNDILAHPKIKAFVSHGGGLSTHEASWYGVPVVAVPFFMDQHSNTKSLISAGVATFVDIKNMSELSFETAIQAILEDESYGNRMKLLSFRFKNRPMKPLDTALWWIEYILKDPTASHLRSPVLDLGLFKSSCYDLILYGILLIGVLFIIIWKFICFMCKCLGLSNKSRNKEKIN